MPEDEFRKVIFDLEIDEDGFPPVSAETLNAIWLGGNRFKIDNTPFFIEGIALGDVVSGIPIPDSERFRFNKVISESDNICLSIIFLDDSTSRIEEVARQLKKFGTYREYGEFRNGNMKMLAVSVLEGKNFDEIFDYLMNLEEEEVLSVAELAIPDIKRQS